MKVFQNQDKNAPHYSSNVAWIDWQEDDEYPLIVAFHSGVYRYKTPQIYDEQEKKFLFEMGLARKPYDLLCEAESVGRAVHQLLRDKCDYVKT